VVNALQANSGIGSSVTELNSAYNHITEQRVFFGNAMNQLQSQQNYLNSEKVNLSAAAISISRADIADSATKLSQAELALNAELAAMSEVSQTSLFDYLK
jgi:flagellin-like hook-associated protein FlgL